MRTGSEQVQLRDLATGVLKMSPAQIATRYATVFEHSPALSAKVSKRLLVSDPSATGGISFAVDFEQFSGLVAPTGDALDGSTGLAPAAAADIIVVYRVVGDAEQQVIDAMWGGEDTDGIGRMENVPLALVQRTAVWQRVDALIREEYGLEARDDLEVQYVKWDDVIAQQTQDPAATEAKEGQSVRPLAVCWLCNDGGAVLDGCNCGRRAHAACVAEAAKSNRHLWLQCPGCQQEWSGKLGLQLAKRRFVRRQFHSSYTITLTMTMPIALPLHAVR
eukprot:COSAG06_NODE_2637_length_6533_cov_2.177184_6_plen_276_part_00